MFLLEHVMLHVSTQQEMDQAKLRLIHYTIVWLVSLVKRVNAKWFTNEYTANVVEKNKDKNLKEGDVKNKMGYKIEPR